MKKQFIIEAARMQKLAGIISKPQLNEARILPTKSLFNLFADYQSNEEGPNDIKLRFARTISETLSLLEDLFHTSSVENLTIDTLFREGEMSNIQDGDEFYAGPTESLRFFQTLPNKFTVTHNMNGDKESFKITKTGGDLFNAERI